MAYKYKIDKKSKTLLKLFILLYANNTVILADSKGELQNALNTSEQHCNTWKLTVNINKSKILLFSKGRHPIHNFHFRNEPLKVVKVYKYLGVYFSRNCSFYRCKQQIAVHATRSMYSLIRNAYRLIYRKISSINQIYQVYFMVLKSGALETGYSLIFF